VQERFTAGKSQVMEGNTICMQLFKAPDGVIKLCAEALIVVLIRIETEEAVSVALCGEQIGSSPHTSTATHTGRRDPPRVKAFVVILNAEPSLLEAPDPGIIGREEVFIRKTEAEPFDLAIKVLLNTEVQLCVLSEERIRDACNNLGGNGFKH